MEIHFCNCNILDETLLDLINKEITPGLSKSEISSFYRKWKENFDTNNIDFDILTEAIASDFHIPDNKSLVGIDFPTWFNINTSNTKRIMILGIDPLRSVNAFEGYDLNNQTLIGTPYAMHRKSMREGNQGILRSYWGFVKSLIDKNYGIYLTDIFKVYFMSQNQRSYNHKYFIENKQKHLKQILEKEIEMINPDLIIVLGNKPLNLLGIQKIKITNKISKNLEYNGRSILPMVHLSGLASGGRKKFISNNLNGEKNINDIDSYLKIVESFINDN